MTWILIVMICSGTGCHAEARPKVYETRAECVLAGKAGSTPDTWLWKCVSGQQT